MKRILEKVKKKEMEYFFNNGNRYEGYFKNEKRRKRNLLF